MNTQIYTLRSAQEKKPHAVTHSGHKDVKMITHRGYSGLPWITLLNVYKMFIEWKSEHRDREKEADVCEYNSETLGLPLRSEEMAPQILVGFYEKGHLVVIRPDKAERKKPKHVVARYAINKVPKKKNQDEENKYYSEPFLKEILQTNKRKKIKLKTICEE